MIILVPVHEYIAIWGKGEPNLHLHNAKYKHKIVYPAKWALDVKLLFILLIYILQPTWWNDSYIQFIY